MCEMMTAVGKGSWRWGWRWRSGSLLRVCVPWDAVVALLSLSGPWVNLYLPGLGNEGELVIGHWIREDSLWRDPALVPAWIFPFSSFPGGVTSDALVSRTQGGGSSGCGGFVLKPEDEQRAANPPPLTCSVGRASSVSAVRNSSEWTVIRK